MDFPEQLKRKDGDDEQEEDVLPMGLSQANRPFSMNQSIFGLIAAAGSKADFHDRFEEHSSDEEGADDSDGEHPSQTSTAMDPMAQTTILRNPDQNKKHQRKFSDNKLMKSVPILSRLTSRKGRSKKEGKKPVSKIQEESEPESPAVDFPILSLINDENLAAPVMSRMLEARAEMVARPSFDIERRSTDKAHEISDLAEIGPSKLSRRLQKIFEFDNPEEIISGERRSPPPPVSGLTKCRIPLLATPRRTPTGLSVHHEQTHLFLRLPS